MTLETTRPVHFCDVAAATRTGAVTEGKPEIVLAVLSTEVSTFEFTPVLAELTLLAAMNGKTTSAATPYFLFRFFMDLSPQLEIRVTIRP